MIRVLGVAALLLVAGCSGSGDPEPGPSTVVASPPPWSEPAAYSFVIERRCDGKESLGVYRVAVADGAVTTAERIDGKQASDAGEEEIAILPLSQLLGVAQTAHDDGGSMTTGADPVDGHPTLIAFDVSEGGTNEDNTCFRISEYKAG